MNSSVTIINYLDNCKNNRVNFITIHEHISERENCTGASVNRNSLYNPYKVRKNYASDISMLISQKRENMTKHRMASEDVPNPM